MIGKIIATSSKIYGRGEFLAYFVFEDNFKKNKQLQIADKLSKGRLMRKIILHNFEGKENEVVFCETDFGDKTIFLIGLGETKNFSPGKFKNYLATTLHILSTHKADHVNFYTFKEIENNLVEAGKNIALGFYLSNYHFTKHKDSESVKKIHLIKKLQVITDEKNLKKLKEGIEFGGLVAQGIYLARDLINEPASHQHPESLVSEALKIKESKNRITIKVLDEEECRKLGMGAFLAVAQGSEKKPKFIVLKYQDNKVTKQQGNKKTICLIGKSLIFDSGGLSLKSAEHMINMKCDMSGGATVLGIFKVLANLDLKDTIIYGILPVCENMPSGKAVRPGDIVTTLNGKTIEVISTDAEGRLTLADALAYAQKYIKPEIIIDLATLTGSAMAGLGREITAGFSNDKKQLDIFLKIAESENENMWPMPLYKPYMKNLKSDVADMKNVGGRYGDVINAALLLSEFVGKTKWIHLDIAGPAFNEGSINGIYSKGGTGWGLTTIVKYIINY